MEEPIIIDSSKVLSRRYSLRKSRGGTYTAFEITVPKEVVEREARRLGITLDELLENYEVECLFNDFHGLHYRFVPKRF